MSNPKKTDAQFTRDDWTQALLMYIVRAYGTTSAIF